MHLKEKLLILVALITNTDYVFADGEQVGLRGYIPDSIPFEQATPQLVFSALRNNRNAYIKNTSEPGVATVTIVNEPAQTIYVFFGKKHWAFPSVVRLRRAEVHDLWATRISYLCGANKRTCHKLEKKLMEREAQVSIAMPPDIENKELQDLLQPLPEGSRPAGKDFYIVQLSIFPDEKELDQRQNVSIETPSDPACKVSGLRYGTPPRYPAMEAHNRIEGTTAVIATINRYGNVIHAVTESTSGNDKLDLSALNSVRIMRFQINGCSNKGSITRLRLPIKFTFTVESQPIQIIDFDASSLGFIP